MTQHTIRVGVVGTAWRAGFFLRLATTLGEHFELVGVVSRSEESAARASAEHGVPAFATPTELIERAHPEVVVVAVPWAATADVIREIDALGVVALAETPPAETAADLRALWADVGAGGRVQIAEQYLLLPGHAARLAVVRSGAIGTPGSVQVSSTHGYHAVSMMRGFLGGGLFGSATVRASATTAPLVDPLTRDGWTGDDGEKPAQTIISTIDFGDGRAGVYDFTDNQWHNQLRHRRIVVRGSRGELVDDGVVRLADAQTILRGRIDRWQLGHDLNLDGHDTEHLSFDGRVVYRNPFVGHRLMDEEIAIATIMRGTGLFARGEAPAPYPLAEAAQDHLVSLAIDEALASGVPVTTAVEAWAPPGV